ncbi:MAG: methyltransferase domain-containing protein [Bacteroidales bacterium]|nr:methyltransferase domain-containing protein [Bacteroidales bacterium]
MRTAELLKQSYNENFSKSEDRWSDTNIYYTRSVACRIVTFIKKNGFNLRPDSRMLDVGCAKGYFTEAFRQQGFDVFGLDISEVAIHIARNNFRRCNFFCADGFNPKLDQTFDLIFMKGFSGTNSHNLDIVAEICNRYVPYLKESGWYVISYTTNFSGEEKEDETVNWTKTEIKQFAKKICGTSHISTEYLGYSFARKFFRRMLKFVGVKRKHSFYIFLKKV